MSDTLENTDRYPLEIESIGEDVYKLMSRGHHDIHEFMRKVREDYDWPLGVPVHVYMKTRPAPKGSGFACLYNAVPAGTRGAWPATYVAEAWNADAYEAKFRLEPTPQEAGRGMRDAMHAAITDQDMKGVCDEVAKK